MLKFVTTDSVPEQTQDGVAFVLEARQHEENYYRDRTDRNIGWITRPEQAIIQNSVVSIAGTGGMGGNVAQIMIRLGIGELRIADPQSFDLSNINRQLGAGLHTVGKSKALETARILRNTTDDYRLIIYPQGIEAGMIEDFVRGSDVIIDEIEFWNIGSCILMHQIARSLGIPILNCLTVGFATYLHYFSPDSARVEDMVGLTLDEALDLERRFLDGNLNSIEQSQLMHSILDCFIPDLPRYFSTPDGDKDHEYILHRLEHEGTASIISTNPPVAGGIVANQALFLMLRRNGITRSIPTLPATPNYYVFDSAHLTSEIIRR